MKITKLFKDFHIVTFVEPTVELPAFDLGEQGASSGLEPAKLETCHRGDGQQTIKIDSLSHNHGLIFGGANISVFSDSSFHCSRFEADDFCFFNFLLHSPHLPPLYKNAAKTMEINIITVDLIGFRPRDFGRDSPTPRE